jgi:hypothetical protein
MTAIPARPWNATGQARAQAKLLMDATGSRRRLQALAARGWSERALAAEYGPGGHCNALARIFRGQPAVTPAVAQRIEDLYDRLWDQPPPARTKSQRVGASLAAANAARRGWPPPLAWDDDEIDDPAASPHPWKRPPHWRSEDLVAEYLELARWGYSRKAAAARLGTTKDAIEKAVVRVRDKQAAA